MKPLWIIAIIIICAVFGIMLSSIISNQNQATIYLFKDGSLAAVKRPVEKGSKKTPMVALNLLLKGSTDKEKWDGYTTQIPEGVEIRDVSISSGIAEASFSRKLEQYGGGATKVQGMIAQIVYTLTEFGNIKKVQVLVEGEKNLVLGGEGFIIDSPMGREDVRF